MVRKAGVTKGRPLFVIEALRTLFNDESFVNFFRAPLSTRIMRIPRLRATVPQSVQRPPNFQNPGLICF